MDLREEEKGRGKRENVLYTKFARRKLVGDELKSLLGGRTNTDLSIYLLAFSMRVYLKFASKVVFLDFISGF